METVPHRPKEENLPSQSIVNEVHLVYPEAENLKSQQEKDYQFVHHTKTYPKHLSSELKISLRCY